ncbi:hypothetical protein AB0F72_08680 [Actinoplanes sp. NPDC023936]|uniref:hypothetical protein n=1 Tax=Actinoplanes sp. NPDC023936 TaxID=3154910 RepID=UPI0033CA5389
MPQVGDRHQPGALPLEWTGEAWTSVCPIDEVPLTGEDEKGRLCCTVCGRRHDELAEMAKQRQ